MRYRTVPFFYSLLFFEEGDAELLLCQDTGNNTGESSNYRFPLDSDKVISSIKTCVGKKKNANYYLSTFDFFVVFFIIFMIILFVMFEIGNHI